MIFQFLLFSNLKDGSENQIWETGRQNAANVSTEYEERQIRRQTIELELSKQEEQLREQLETLEQALKINTRVFNY